VHYYSHVHARKGENPVAKVVEEATKKLVQLGVSFQINYSDIVRTVGPNWYQVVLDIQITHSKQTGERESTPKPD
jgi:tRNA G37 N-methylase Trm5